jgi:formylglycine-generating enzyme required for sulfatase activity
MKHLFPLLMATVFCAALHGSDIKILHTELIHDNQLDGSPAYAYVTLSWDNSWYNEKNYDAAWIFFKFENGDNGNRHVPIAAEGHEIIHAPIVPGSIQPAEDLTGFFIHPSVVHRGPVQWTLKITLESSVMEQFRHGSTTFEAYAIEMVYIPQGGFTLGDPDTTALRFKAFYRSDSEGGFAGLYSIDREDQVIEVGAARGSLYYRSDRWMYGGDQQGPIPAQFPKGVEPFYMMKYELTQGQYAAFLSSLSASQSQLRVNFGGKDYYQNRGSITAFDGHYRALSPQRPCNFISWDDAMAYADWAGLRPYTEFEYTKACRGPETPLAGEYPWNTASKASLMRRVLESDELGLVGSWNESQLAENNREYFGASYYWVMDLAGSVWERVVTPTREAGRKFTGSHGDGQVDGYGFATNDDWPTGTTDTDGFGFRGGGYYTHGRLYGNFNPHSPVGYRTYGGWSGGHRVNAYGSRFVRTASR